MKKIIYFGIVFIIFLCACRKPVVYSDIPEIKFINFEKINQTNGLLTFYFQDGEGDIGLDSWEINPPFDYNFFCDYYEKRHGAFVKIDSIEDFKGELIPFILNGRIPRLSRLAKESINGEIYYALLPYCDEFSPYTDTVRLEFYIVDRKLNKSNIEKIVVIR